MDNKTLKFKTSLAQMIQSGEKTTTWRMFDEKNLQTDDTIDLINKDTKEQFARAILTEVYEKKLSELTETDYKGHEQFSSEEEMYQTYRNFYGDRVTPDTMVKIIRFKLI